MWSGGKLAFVQASGSPDPTRSHFDAQDYMESGTPGVKRTSDGWMNRLLGELPGKPSPTRGLAVGPVLPRNLRRTGAGRIDGRRTGGDASDGARPAARRRRIRQALRRWTTRPRARSANRLSARREVLASLDPSAMEKEQMAANNGAPLPNGFPDDAARLARLMRNDPNVQLAFVALGGWDTPTRRTGGPARAATESPRPIASSTG